MDRDKMSIVVGDFKKDDKRRAELAQLVRDMRDGLSAHVELAQLMAKLTRAKFIALVEQGFTVDQALMLCK